MRVRAMMQRHVVCLGPDDSLHEAYELMQEGGFRHIPITEDGVLIGIVSDRDVLLQATQQDRVVLVPDMPLGDVMTKGVITCATSARLADVADTMVENKIDALPVTDGDGRLVGIVTSTDLLMLMGIRDHDLGQRPLPFTFRVERRGGGTKFMRNSQVRASL